jgi:RNA recognition motif-containing protein
MNTQYPSNIQYGMGPSAGQPIPNNSGFTLYVGNLDKDLDRQTVEAFFMTQQNVEAPTKVDFKVDMAGDSRGFAFITYSSQKAAANAKISLNHSRIRNNEIAIAFMKPPQDLNQDANLFISNLDRKVTSKELEELCAPYGSIVSCKVKYSQDSTPQYSLGYGYVQFEQPASANDCREGLSGKVLHEKPVKVEKFTPRGKRNTNNQLSNLYIKDFPEKFNQKQVEDFIEKNFPSFGKIASKGVFTDPKMNKFYAFVAFESADNAKKAIEAYNGYSFPGETQTKLYVDYAQSREQRKQMLTNKFQTSKNETNVFIKSLKGSVTEARLREVFSKFGSTTSVCVKAHELQGKPELADKKVMKFGFINFADAEDAKKAMTEGKKDEEVKALIDENHYKNQEYLYFAQPKTVRTKYLKMQRVNQRPAQQYQKMMKMYESFVAMMSQQWNKGGNPNYKQGQNFKAGPKQHFNRRKPF